MDVVIVLTGLTTTLAILGGIEYALCKLRLRRRNARWINKIVLKNRGVK